MSCPFKAVFTLIARCADVKGAQSIKWKTWFILCKFYTIVVIIYIILAMKKAMNTKGLFLALSSALLGSGICLKICIPPRTWVSKSSLKTFWRFSSWFYSICHYHISVYAKFTTPSLTTSNHFLWQLHNIMPRGLSVGCFEWGCKSKAPEKLFRSGYLASPSQLFRKIVYLTFANIN